MHNTKTLVSNWGFFKSFFFNLVWGEFVAVQCRVGLGGLKRCNFPRYVQKSKKKKEKKAKKNWVS